MWLVCALARSRESKIREGETEGKAELRCNRSGKDIICYAATKKKMRIESRSVDLAGGKKGHGLSATGVGVLLFL